MPSPEITGRILYSFQSSWPTVRNVSIAAFVGLFAVFGGFAPAPDGVGLSSSREPARSMTSQGAPAGASVKRFTR